MIYNIFSIFYLKTFKLTTSAREAITTIIYIWVIIICRYAYSLALAFIIIICRLVIQRRLCKIF